MKTVDIRNKFIEYFELNGHKLLESAPLVPINDPSLLWINAGVVPLKKYFDGSVVPDSKRLMSSQKCIRTNDIENVGYTARHQTYFEMLGNFSIGDYFKKEAIEFAFEFLTSPKWLGISQDKLYMTVYPSDSESYDMWKSLGISEDHIISVEDNFWEIGEGPCGPDTEIFFDRGASYDARGTELIRDDIENDRYIEIWNVVLSQFNSKAGLERENYPELPSKNIDTGMGLERMACVMQGVETNYEIDIFSGIISKIEHLSNLTYSGQTEFRVIADHIRTLCLAIADSALPSNEGRGYVIRRVLRRAVKFGKKIGFEEPFLYKIVDSVPAAIPYYNIDNQLEMIKTIIKGEEEKFYKTLASGEKKLEQFITTGSISGEESFLLYDTFGFPIELTIELAKQNGIDVDIEEFNKHLLIQKERSRESRSKVKTLESQSELLLNLTLESEFIGYNTLSSNSNIIAIIQDDNLKESASGEMAIILDKTPFYAQSGGQVSDIGLIDGLEVLEVVKAPHGQHLHIVNSSKEVKLENVSCIVNEEFRTAVAINHSATHILNYALKSHFGQHVMQQGSYVDDTKLRFDFTHFEKITAADMISVNNIINNAIKNWTEISIQEMNIKEAKALGAAALFGEKYGDVVRVVKLGESLELCGGTHIDNFELLNKFSIVNFESKGSGIYRIEAVTNSNVSTVLKQRVAIRAAEIRKFNEELLNKFKNNEDKKQEFNEKIAELQSKIEKTKASFETTLANISDYKDVVAIDNFKSRVSEFKKEFDKLNKQASQNIANSDDLLNTIETSIREICSMKVVIIELDSLDVGACKVLIDTASDKFDLDLIAVINTHSSLVFTAKASDDAVKKGVNCGQLVKEAAIICGGNGGGRPNFASAGGKNSENINEAMMKMYDIVESIC